jgi:cell division protein FtsN
MAIGSFAFGFFVIARLWPSTPRAAATAGADPMPPDPAVTVRHAAAATSQPPAAAHVPSAARPPAPMIDPLTPEERAIESGKPGPNSPADPNAQAGAGQANAPTSGDAGATNANQPDATTATSGRGHRDSPAGTQDAAANRAAQSDGAVAEEGTVPGPGLYRVQLGIFRDLSDAQDRLREAQDKGFDAKITRFTSAHGGTRYRVQAGEFQDRDHADVLKRDLVDEGIKAKVIDH